MRLGLGSLTCLLSVAVLTGSVSPLGATVTVYTSLSDFLAAAPGATLHATFESHPGGGTSTFTEGGLTFSSPASMFIISPTTPGTTSPLPPSKMLSASGPESFFVTLASNCVTQALGLTILTNRFGPHRIRLYGSNNAVFFTYLTTQAKNTIGFVGFVSTTPIHKMHWLADQGEVQNTALDDFYVKPNCTDPAIPSSWGRIKALYRFDRGLVTP